MPIVDGGLSTRMIRFLEKESGDRRQSDHQGLQNSKNRTSIIALSTLLDDNRPNYMENGFVLPFLKVRSFGKRWVLIAIFYLVSTAGF